jgi:hypothetical protein
MIIFAAGTSVQPEGNWNRIGDGAGGSATFGTRTTLISSRWQPAPSIANKTRMERHRESDVGLATEDRKFTLACYVLLTDNCFRISNTNLD